jgi:hypothetical protein
VSSFTVANARAARSFHVAVNGTIGGLARYEGKEASMGAVLWFVHG